MRPSWHHSPASEAVRHNRNMEGCGLRRGEGALSCPWAGQQGSLIQWKALAGSNCIHVNVILSSKWKYSFDLTTKWTNMQLSGQSWPIDRVHIRGCSALHVVFFVFYYMSVRLWAANVAQAKVSVGWAGSRWCWEIEQNRERARGEWSYVCELAHCIGLDSDVVLLELLLDLIDACGDVLGLGANKGKGKAQTPDQFRNTGRTQ